MFKTNQELLDHMTSYVYKNFAELETIAPMWTIIGENGEVLPVVAPMQPGQKDDVAAIIRRLCHENNAVRIGFMFEAWVGSDTKYSGGNIHLDPNRREAITFHHFHCRGL